MAMSNSVKLSREAVLALNYYSEGHLEHRCYNYRLHHISYTQYTSLRCHIYVRHITNYCYQNDNYIIISPTNLIQCFCAVSLITRPCLVILDTFW